MTEWLSPGFMQNAFLGGLLVSLICGLLSVFIVLRRMAFVGAGISHSAFGGVALGFLLQVDPFWTGLLFSILVAFLIEDRPEPGAYRRRHRHRHFLCRGHGPGGDFSALLQDV